MPYCKKCGKELEAGDLFCSSCGTPVGETIRAIQIETLEVPYPEGDSARLEIVVRSAGRVNVSGGASEKFVEGTVEYDDSELAPVVRVQGDRVRIVQEERFVVRVRSNPVNRWDLMLGDGKPFSMDVKCGVSMGDWDLGGLPLTDLTLQAGVSNNSVGFDSPNPEALRLLKFSAGAGDIDISGLLNANFDRMKVEGGVGEVKLGFTGKSLDRDARVDIGGGVGSFRITVDETVPTRVSVEGLASVSVHGGFVQTRSRGFPMGGVYTNDAYENKQGPSLRMEIRMGVGSVSIDTTR
jgi:hypothetical protein